MFVVKSLFIASDSNPFGGVLHIQTLCTCVQNKAICKCALPMQMSIIVLTYCKVFTNKIWVLSVVSCHGGGCISNACFYAVPCEIHNLACSRNTLY